MFSRVFRLHPVAGFVVIALVLGGCGNNVSPAETQAQAFEDLRNEIRNAVDDPTRESKAIELVDTLAANLQTLQENLSYRSKHTRELNSDYDTTRETFETFFGQVNRQIQANRKQVGKTQRALFAVLMPDERSSISRTHSKAMKAAIRSVQAT